jgi:uncharacterized ferritin-like protein (DUF455 family)
MRRPHELRAAVLAALRITSPAEKAADVRALYDELEAGTINIDPAARLPPVQSPGRPQRPLLVEPRAVPRRKLASPEGRAALIHAIAHIEFNAINLALDAIARFADLPEDYHRDWLKVAAEEAYHYTLLAAHLQTIGYGYGDFPAHNGLWEMAETTADDPLARMGLVPRILEARGLDVTPTIQARLKQAGDTEAVAILDIILRDEIGHVAIGNRWFAHLCAQRNVDPQETFERLLKEYAVAPPHPPFNEAARLRAGFTLAELARWTGNAER